jgi:YfiH family protein
MTVVDEQFLNLSSTEQSARLDGVDALISPLPDCCLAISTADCVPILLYDTRARVIAAVHAGWRGTVARILTQVLNQMTLLYGTEGKNVKAVIGPSISLQAFEVGDEVYEQFFSANFPMRQIAVRQEKWHIDLWHANRLCLETAGVMPQNITVCGICTHTHHDAYFSARRLGIRSGRIFTGIMLK